MKQYKHQILTPCRIVGEPDVKTVQPFNKVDLCQIPFQEIIRNFQILEAENIPESPLLYLYPNTPKDEAFGKYYCEKTGSKDINSFCYFFLLVAYILLESKITPKPASYPACCVG